MFLGLRMTEGISVTEFREVFGVFLEQIYGKVLEKYKKLELLEEPFHLETMLDNIYSIIKPTAMEKNHDITFIRKGVIHESLIGDANRVKQVLLNLITNAVKYTPDNGIIRVTTEEVPMGKAGWACYRFVVEDNGIGMSEEYMKQVFEPFSRAGVPGLVHCPGHSVHHAGGHTC